MENAPIRWFEYRLSDAWGLPISGVEIVEDDEGCRVGYGKPEGGRPKDYRYIALDEGTMAQIKGIVSNPDLYGYEDLYDESCTMILDGYTQEMAFYDGTVRNKIGTTNLGCYKRDYMTNPHASAIMSTLDKLAQVLAPLGVPGAYFDLEEDVD
ncbi:hypothetical protein [uncultured Pseudoramibacter sp.]|uniref:hypothetical protein n=1 Tax=uncultured Pseudoramibacter sp. TaxID=1623493 RepID=UPI0025F2192D|nr:hypothetical protein [uncultured Pseudoramibacter sp.]